MGPLDATLGAVFIGTVVAAVLYGFTCIQTWYYFTHYPSDPWYIKLLAGGVLFTDSIHQALITHMVYTYVITYFGVDAELGMVVWSLDIEVVFNGFTTLFVQCFLAMRIYKLSNGNRLATGFVMLFVIAEFVVSIMFAFQALPLKTFAQFATLNTLSKTINALSAVGDVVIAAFLCYLLQTSRTGFQSSETVITKLIVFTINTGLLTSLCAMASLICISVWPHAWIYIGFYYCIGRLYCNTLLATLNARKGLRSAPRTDDISLSLNAQQKMGHSVLGTTSRSMPGNISIKIDTTQEYIQDEQYSSSNDDTKNFEAV